MEDMTRRLWFAGLGLGLAAAAAPEAAAAEGGLDAEPLARVAVQDVVQRERVARDFGDWEEMAACFHPDSRVEISWFKGTGAEFAASSARMAAGGMRAFHQMGPTLVTVRRDRALADTGCAIHLLGRIDEADVDVIGHVRLLAGAERRDGVWKISRMKALYLQDMIVPLSPGREPRIDRARLEGFRPSYRHVSYMLALNGHPPAGDLAGIDRPETAAALRAAEKAWLAGATAGAPGDG